MKNRRTVLVALAGLFLGSATLLAAETYKYKCTNDACKDKGKIETYDTVKVRYCGTCGKQLVRLPN